MRHGIGQPSNAVVCQNCTDSNDQSDCITKPLMVKGAGKETKLLILPVEIFFHGVINTYFMEFSEWLLLSEIGIADVPLTLDREYDNYSVNFTHNGTGFRVIFKISNLIDYSIPDVYEIVLYGPKGIDSTGTAGTAASGIYSKTLAAIKLLLDSVEVKGLTFSPSEPAMALVYKKLFERLGTQFVQISPTEYLKRKILRNQLNSFDAMKKMNAYRRIIGAARGARAEDRQIRADKAIIRPIRAALQSKIGQIVTLHSYDESPQPFLILSLENEYVNGVEINGDEPQVSAVLYKYLTPETPDKRTVKNFLNIVRQNLPNMDEKEQIANILNGMR